MKLAAVSHDGRIFLPRHVPRKIGCGVQVLKQPIALLDQSNHLQRQQTMIHKGAMVDYYVQVAVRCSAGGGRSVFRRSPVLNAPREEVRIHYRLAARFPKPLSDVHHRSA
ncbi:unnamed protein product [Cuscuta epithymum]|uniref:Uncharacterized protein n=1 Tax=Cuscuta epithymum TaxID=186058 RepID=A0AAV0CU35_9ASTE|nr:unnamed protein product [Cuscuta epithymum]